MSADAVPCATGLRGGPLRTRAIYSNHTATGLLFGEAIGIFPRPGARARPAAPRQAIPTPTRNGGPESSSHATADRRSPPADDLIIASQADRAGRGQPSDIAEREKDQGSMMVYLYASHVERALDGSGYYSSTLAF